MVDIHISSGQGISQALAEYAKNLNNGKALKINAKQWQSIMNKINEINQSRDSNNTIYSGNNNIFGSYKNNFRVNEGKISFSDNEMRAILKEMGLKQDLIEKEFATDINIKGLTIEKHTSVNTPNLHTDDKPKIQVKHPTPKLNSIKTYNKKDTQQNQTTENFVTESKYNINTSERLTTENQPKIQVSQKPKPTTFENSALTVKQAQVQNSEQTKETANISVNTYNSTDKISPQKEDSHKPNNNHKIQNIKLAEKGQNFEFYHDGKIKSFELNVNDLNWDKQGRKSWNKDYNLATHDVEFAHAKNKKGQVIANYHEGKYYIGVKEVSLEKFQKFVDKNANTLSINYKPELKTINQTKLAPIKPRIDLSTSKEILKLKIVTPQKIEIPKVYTRKTLSQEFYDKVSKIAKKINCDPAELLAVMNSESGLNPSSRNKWTKATGLIQFMPQTALSLGTTVDKLRNMSQIEQLDYVEKFLVRAKNAYIKGDRTLTAGDLYGLVFMPAKSGEDVLAVRGSKAYKQNAGLDYDGDGVISRNDLEAHVSKKHVEVSFKENV